MVGETVRTLRTVSSNRSGVGRPVSRYSVPPNFSTVFMVWLPANVWLHGSQSRNTGGSCSTKGHRRPFAAMFETSIRCVVITALGTPTDPEVNSSFATVSCPTPVERGQHGPLVRPPLQLREVDDARRVRPGPR